jgi:hypothetical protein
MATPPAWALAISAAGYLRCRYEMFFYTLLNLKKLCNILLKLYNCVLVYFNFLCIPFLQFTTTFNTIYHMDHAARPVIMSFIKDFSLRKPDGVVAFDAIVVYTIAGAEKSFDTEVLIVTSDNQEAVYFLNPAMSGDGLPDMFNANGAYFNYTARESLDIQRDFNGGQYTLRIFPKQH